MTIPGNLLFVSVDERPSMNGKSAQVRTAIIIIYEEARSARSGEIDRIVTFLVSCVGMFARNKQRFNHTIVDLIIKRHCSYLEEGRFVGYEGGHPNC
jgi:hypothetical protein